MAISTLSLPLRAKFVPISDKMATDDGWLARCPRIKKHQITAVMLADIPELEDMEEELSLRASRMGLPRADEQNIRVAVPITTASSSSPSSAQARPAPAGSAAEVKASQVTVWYSCSATDDQQSEHISFHTRVDSSRVSTCSRRSRISRHQSRF